MSARGFLYWSTASRKLFVSAGYPFVTMAATLAYRRGQVQSRPVNRDAGTIRCGFEECSMSNTSTENAIAYQPVRAARGTAISCKGWQQEAALRMLMNNLDPEVAERPEELIVYGGRGKAARNWKCFHAIARALQSLEDDETLIVQSGKPVGIFRTHAYAPRVLI